MNKTDFLNSQTTRYIGAGLVGAILAGGVTFGVMHNSSQDIKTVSEMGAKATSENIWHSIGEMPVGWDSRVTSMETKDSLIYHQGESYASNEQSTCSFTVNKSTLPKSEFGGVGADYLTQQRVLSYGENRKAKDAVLKTIPVKTSAGEIPFWAASFVIENDVDGDGKKEKMKEIRLAHGYQEIADKDGNIPITEITYSCNSVGEWSEEQFKTLMGGLTLNVTGETPPAIPSPEVKAPKDAPVSEKLLDEPKKENKDK